MSAVKKTSIIRVTQHNKPPDFWVVIEDKMYDLTKFRSEHPGGEETLDDAAGKDATKDFIDLGHSSEGRKMMEKYYVGDMPASDRKIMACLTKTYAVN